MGNMGCIQIIKDLQTYRLAMIDECGKSNQLLSIVFDLHQLGQAIKGPMLKTLACIETWMASYFLDLQQLSRHGGRMAIVLSQVLLEPD